MRTEVRKMTGNQRTISNLVRKLDGDNKCNICVTNIKDLGQKNGRKGTTLVKLLKLDTRTEI